MPSVRRYMEMELRIFTEPQQGASYEQLLGMARAAEEGGFGAFFRSDHFLRFGPGDGLPGPTDSWVTLAGLARETSRIRLGAIVTGMWTTPQGERFSFSGRHYTLADCPALPKPVQRPRPPVIVGGIGGRRTPRLAARYADECNVAFVPADVTGVQYQRVRQACEQAGRDPASLRLSVAHTVCCGRDEAEYARRAASIGREPGELRESSFAGTPEEVAERLRAFADLGAERAYLQVLDLDDLDQVALLAKEVMPLVA